MKRTFEKPLWTIAASVILVIIMISCLICNLAGCSSLESSVNDIKGQLVGVSFNCYFYDSYGNKTLTVIGERIGMRGNVIKTTKVSSDDGDTSYGYELSSVITISVDGKEIQSCGDSIIFEETGLNPDVNFNIPKVIESNSTGKISENTILSMFINDYKNLFGKSSIVVVKSELGIPIVAYSGNNVYYEIRDDLPKTTKLMIDGKALYIHRVTFQIIDTKLIQ